MIPSHAALPLDHVEAVLSDDAIDAENRRIQARLAAIRAEDDDTMAWLLAHNIGDE